jgi:glycosyltransferase involved in cell wall biosynthesis
MLDVLYELAERELSFNVAICGQNFRVRPEEFEIAKEKLAGRIIHFGYAQQGEYSRLLSQAHITLSTAQHEFFGIAVLEAVASEVFPILPNRLSYPEIIPAEFHESCLYTTRDQLLARLEWALSNRDQARSIAADLAKSTNKYRWSEMAQEYDNAIELVAGI